MWNEKPHRDLAEGGKLTRADIVLSGPDDGLTSANSEALMYYRADGTSSYVSVMHVTGTLEGRRGSFVLVGEGSYDGRTARGRSRVVEGSGAGGLAGLSGSAESVSTHENYPFMSITLKYDIG